MDNRLQRIRLKDLRYKRDFYLWKIGQQVGEKRKEVYRAMLQEVIEKIKEIEDEI
jgi:hypothetical protein